MLQAVTVLTIFYRMCSYIHTHLPILDALFDYRYFLIVRLRHVMYYQSHGTIFLFI